jgi:hypothetical protein
MRVLLSAAGRAFLRDFVVAFFFLGSGILAAPNYRQAAALASAATLGALVGAVRGLRVFVPGISTGLAKALNIPVAYAEVAITGITTVIVGFIALAEGVLSAPDLETGRAAALAGLLGIGTALWRLIQAYFTPGETPAPSLGFTPPPQPVPPEALPTPIPAVPDA